jgi:hypothetical protein
MARIGITLNEVVRDFIGQFTYTYNKYKKGSPFFKEVDLKENPVKDFDLIKHFNFNNVKELNEFLYTEASLEIFGHADQLHTNIIPKLNMFISDMTDEGHEVIIVSREANKSIPATFFFFTKLGIIADNFKFVKDTSHEWNGIDILITANPVALECKPEGKISVKVDATYNIDTKSDYAVKDLFELIDDEEFLNKILNND